MNEIKVCRASASDVASVIDTIAEATSDEDEDVVMIACLGTAVLIQDPNINSNKFLEVVQSASEFIALQLATVGELVN